MSITQTSVPNEAHSFLSKVRVPCLMVFDDAHVMKAALMGAAHWHEALIALPWDTARLQSLAQSAGLRRPHGAKKKGSRWTTRFDFWKSFSCSPMFANKDPEARTIETLEMISYQLYDRRSIFGSLLKSISLTVWPSVSWHEKHKNLPKGKNRSSFHIVGGPWGNPGAPNQSTRWNHPCASRTTEFLSTSHGTTWWKVQVFFVSMSLCRLSWL